MNLGPLILLLLARDCNKDTVKITGTRVNRGAGYRLEVPVVLITCKDQGIAMQQLEDVPWPQLKERSLLSKSVALLLGVSPSESSD